MAPPLFFARIPVPRQSPDQSLWNRFNRCRHLFSLAHELLCQKYRMLP